MTRRSTALVKTVRFVVLAPLVQPPDGDHGSVIGMPDIFAFFAKHSKPASR